MICRENSWILQICTSICLVATSSVRLLAAFANEYDVELCHFNVDQAFVRADLNEDVFMRLPEGCGALSGNIVKLNKSLYCWIKSVMRRIMCSQQPSLRARASLQHTV